MTLFTFFLSKKRFENIDYGCTETRVYPPIRIVIIIYIIYYKKKGKQENRKHHTDAIIIYIRFKRSPMPQACLERHLQILLESIIYIIYVYDHMTITRRKKKGFQNTLFKIRAVVKTRRSVNPYSYYIYNINIQLDCHYVIPHRYDNYIYPL